MFFLNEIQNMCTVEFGKFYFSSDGHMRLFQNLYRHSCFSVRSRSCKTSPSRFFHVRAEYKSWFKFFDETKNFVKLHKDLHKYTVQRNYHGMAEGFQVKLVEWVKIKCFLPCPLSLSLSLCLSFNPMLTLIPNPRLQRSCQWISIHI